MEVTNSTGFLLQTMLLMSNHQWNNSLYNTIHNMSSMSNTTHNIEETHCYGVYGCFPLGYPWVDEKRPLAWAPRSPAQVDVRFPIFNIPVREHPRFVDINDPDEVKHLGINPKGWLYIVTHGYIESGDRPWLQGFVNAFLEKDPEASVMLIDWRKASVPPYTQCVADIRLVGAIAAHVVHMLYQELGMQNLDKVHILGHSLGSHVCGYVGYYLQRDFGLKLGRITGMDPAEPMFSDTDPIVRLDSSDAKFVDIIHTDATPWVERWPRPGGLGMYQAIGHVDFYPNGGNNQAGCNDPMEKFITKHEDSFFWGFQEFFGCNHLRCHQLYTDAIPQRCPFVAIGCESYEKFLAGDCFECDVDGHYCIDFGPNAQNSYRRLIENGVMIEPRPIRAYMITGDDSPYCQRSDLSYPPVVESINGPAADILAPGDRIHQIDGISTIGLTNQHLFSILAHGDGPAVIEIEYSFPEYISQNSLCVTTKLAQITVERENGCLGLTLRGGGEYPLVVTNVRMHGPVFKTGQIKPGDRVLRVDNASLVNKTLSEAQHILKNGHMSGYTNLTIEYDVSVMQSVEFSMGPLLLEIERPLNEKLGLILSNYSSAVNQSDIYHSKLDEVQPAGIYIASILPASIADRCGALSVGDQLLSVDETIVENSAFSPEEVSSLLDANCTKGYTQLQILPAHTLVRRRGIACSSPKYGFNTVDSRKNLSAAAKNRRLVRKSSLPQPAENGGATLHPNVGLCKAETIQLVLDCSQGSGICLGPKTPCGRGYMIAQILPDSVAERSGCLQKGDRILAVNKMYNLDANPIRQVLGDFGSKTAANHYHNQPQTTNWVELELEFDVADAVIPSSGVFNIKLIRQNKCGLGITVNGNSHGSFVISEVKPGSAAHRTGSLRAGDVLLAVDNHPVQHYNLDLLLKESKNEYITLTVKRNSLPDFLFDAQQKTNLLYGSTEDNAYIYGNRYNESPSLKSNNNVDYFQLEDNAQYQQQLRRPMWNRPTTYDILPGSGNPMTQSTGTLKAIHHSPQLQQSASTENLQQHQSTSQLLTAEGELCEDRYDDIVHYKMASMNINSTNYVSAAGGGAGIAGGGSGSGGSNGSTDQIHQIIFSVRLEPNGGPLGITLAGSDDLQKPIKISALTEGGIAYNTGQLKVGDCLLAINGESICGVPLTTATKLLHKFENVVDLQISRTECVGGARSHGLGGAGGEPQPQAVYAKVQRRPRSPSITDALSTNSNSSGAGNCRTLHVTLFKDRVYDDYGFSVSDGLYERGVYINRIRSGGPADLVGMLRPFDRIVQVNGTKTQDFDCCLTVPLIAAAGDKIDLVIQRPLTGE